MATTRIETETPWKVFVKHARKCVLEYIGQSTICDAEVRFCLTVVKTDDGRVVRFFQHPGVISYVSPILLYDY